MVNIILHGCNGAMGKVITDLAAQEADINIAAGIDLNAVQMADYPVFPSCEACDTDADVIVDFSVAPAVDAVIAYARKRKLPLVLCTTGLSDAQLEAADAAAKEIPVLRSANMSLGVNTLFKLAALTAQILADKGYDIEIMEKHHHRKLDAPSGTALAIADAINEAMDGRYTYNVDRTTRRAKRDPNEIGIQALRGGSIVGEHEVFYCGQDEVIEIRHTAYSRAIFGKGALQAAMWIAGREPGMYQMMDVIG